MAVPRHASRAARYRRRRLSVLGALVLLVAVGVLTANWLSGGGSPRGAATLHGDAATSVPAVESGLMPWQLAAPVSREVVLPGPSGHLTILGGLSASGVSSNGVFSLDTGSGSLQSIGSLSQHVHDSSGAVIRGADVLFGGGSPATTGVVQSFPAASAPGVSGTDVGSLPQPRSDSTSATIGDTTYVVGGYDGTNPDPSVLATTDGRTYRNVASLSVPVRYPAVAAAGNELYVFGGQAITGSNAGAPVDVIQLVDPATHGASVVGHLPEPLAGAAAFTVGGDIYLAGGDTTTAQPSTLGQGTTQLGVTQATPTSGSGQLSDPTVSSIWAYDPASKKLSAAGRLQVPVSHAGAAVVGSTAWIVGGESNGSVVSVVQMVEPNSAFGVAGATGAGSPYFGSDLLVADRGNNRLLLFNAAMQLVWSYPTAGSPPNPDGFFFPDDAFFVNHGTAIITNEEENETIEEIAYPSGKLLWSYGHPKTPGTAPGYLHEPDDAYLLRSGQISVADAQNCRVLVINPNGTVANQIGTTGRCFHQPPVSVGSPNGDTPLADGNLLISEINGSWISEYTTGGSLVWTVTLPTVSYVSDPQQIGSNLYLVADYASPGQFVEFNRAGQILYRYVATSGPGELNHPSLAELLPDGIVMLNDDYSHRMVAIDPHNGALVWQYGVTGHAGAAPGMLNTPDGFDILGPNGTTPTHTATG